MILQNILPMPFSVPELPKAILQALDLENHNWHQHPYPGRVSPTCRVDDFLGLCGKFD